MRAAPDLRQATAYVMPLGGVNTEGVVKALNRNRAELRRLVTAQIDLRFSPELHFVADASFDRMDRTRDAAALARGQPRPRRRLTGAARTPRWRDASPAGRSTAG